MLLNHISQAKDSACRAARAALSVVLAVSLCPAAPVAYADEQSGSFTLDSAVDQAQSGETDITAQWAAGGMGISAGGTYVLSDDVYTDGALTIAAPEGETVTLDLCGHSVEVRGAVQAAVALDGSAGQVRIVDSAFDDAVARGQRAADDAPSATLRLVAADADASVAAVRLNASEDAGANPQLALSHVAVQAALVSAAAPEAGQEDAGKLDCYGVFAAFGYDADADALDVSLDGCTVDAVVANDDVAAGQRCEWASANGASVDAAHRGAAVAVFSKVKGVALDGKTALSAESDGGAAQLYSTCDGAFALGESFAVDGTVLAFADGNEAGRVLATCASEQQARQLAAQFADATGEHACEASGADIVCAQGVPAASAGDAGNAGASSAGASAATQTFGKLAPANIQVGPREHAANALLVPAVEGTPVELAEWVRPLADQSVDLNKAWTNTAGSYTITESGTYFLSSDIYLTDAATLFVSGKNTQVTLNLNGHAMHFDATASGGHDISVSGTASLSIEGGNAGAIVDTGLNIFDVVYMNSTGSLTVRNAALSVRPSQAHSNPKALNMRAIALPKGSATIEKSTLTVDQTNVSTASVETLAVNPAGVYAAGDSAATQLSVSDTVINVVASPATKMGNADDLDDEVFAGPGFSAYGVYSAAARTATTVSGCTINVTSAYGQAIGVAARNAVVSGANGSGAGLSVAAASNYVAAAVCSLGEGGVKLDADVRFSVADDVNARRSAALYATVDKAFSLQKGFTGAGATLLERVGGQENADGMIAATLDYLPTTAQLSALSSQLSSALGADAACAVEATAQGVRFALQESNAPVEVVHANGPATAYATVEQAFSAAADDETVRLRKDVDAVSLSGGAAGITLTLDLAGHAVTSISDSSPANVVVTSSGNRARIDGAALVRGSGSVRTEAAVAYAGTGSLTVRDVDIDVAARSHELAGVQVAPEAAGALTLENVNVSATSSIAAVSALAVASTSKAASVAVSGGSLSAVQLAASATAYGVRSLSTSTAVSLADCPVSARAQAGGAYGAYVSGPFGAASEQPAGQSISASTESVSVQGVAGVYAFGKNADVQLRNCAVAARSDVAVGDAAYWALSASDADACLALDGTCAFESAAGKTINEKGASLKLSEGFASAGDGLLYVAADSLEADVFAITAAAGQAAQEQAALFEPLAGTAYEGWTAAAREDGKLAWSNEPVVRNVSSGVSYASLAKALGEAAAGDTLQLVADGASHIALTVSQDVTLDLAGHTFTVYADKAGAASAVSVSAGVLAFSDSADQKGVLDLRLGAASERVAHSAAAGTPYAGVRVADGAGVRMDAARVQVRYVGGGPTEQIKTQDVAGVYAQGGSVELTGAAQLCVSGAQDDGGACAGAAYGIYLGAAAGQAAGAANVSADSRVDVANNGGLIDLGYVRDGTYDSEFEEGYQALVRIQPDEHSALYQEILAKFRSRAQLDKGNDASGENSFGMRCYYANRVSLDDGTIFWAVSKPVPAGQETLDNIVPEVIFVQSLYQAAPKAFGIAAASAAAANVAVRGNVRAASAQGDAYGIAAAGNGSWTVDGAQVSAQGGSQAYQGTADEQINLNDYLQVDNPPTGKNWFYPSFADPHLVCEKLPVASAVSCSDQAAVTLDGALRLQAEAADASEIDAGKVTVGAAFAPQAEGALRVSNPAGANTPGAVFAVAVAGAKLAAGQFVDAYGKLSPELAADGSLVWGGPYTVTFHGEESVVAVYDNLVAGASVALPDPQLMEKRADATKQYAFVGWSRTADAAEAEVAADAGSVAVEGNADYYPVYRTAAKSVTVTFDDLRAADGSVLAAQQCQVDYGSTVSATAHAQVPAQGDYQAAGGTWRFVGWRDSLGRVWDGAGLATDVTFDYATFTGASAGAVSLSAFYVLVGPGQHLVTFKVDGRAYAYAAENGEAASFYRATNSAALAPAKVAAAAGYLYTFEGWHVGWLAGTAVDKSNVEFDAMASLPAVDGDVVYTACFTATLRQAYVRFKYWKPTGDSYAYLPSSPASVPYGTDPISEANKLVRPGDVVVVDGLTYEFLGWSVRDDDREPLYTDSLPACTNTDATSERLTYYGIYKLIEQKVTVTFYDGSAVYATAADQLATATVDEALAAAGVTRPPARTDGQVFKGWATKPDATTPDVNGATTLSKAAGTSASLDLYAVYGAAFEPTLTFVSADGSVLGSAKIASGATLAQAEGIPAVPAVAGKFFRGWALGTGVLVDVSAGITADTRLVASYGDIVTNAVQGDEETNVTGYVDVSAAVLNSAAAQGANQVTFYLTNSNSAGQTLAAQAKVNGDAIVGDAVYSAKYLIDGNGVDVADNAGRVTLHVSCGAVGANAKVRAYWTRADGSVGYTDAMTSDASGWVSFTLSNYSALSTDGNVAIAEVGAAAGSLGGSSVAGGSLGGAAATTGAALAGSTLSGTLELASASGAALDGAAADGAALDGAAAALDDTGADAAADDPAARDGIDLLADGVDTSVAMSDIAGNPVMWVLAVLLAAVAAALAWYFLVGRKRGAAAADDDDDEAGWSDDVEAAGKPAAPAAATPSPSAAADDASKTGGISF